MSRHCVLLKGSEKSRQKNHISYFTFPKEPERRQTWIRQQNTFDSTTIFFEPPPPIAVRSRQFRSKCFTDRTRLNRPIYIYGPALTQSVKVLNTDAVSTIFNIDHGIMYNTEDSDSNLKKKGRPNLLSAS